MVLAVMIVVAVTIPASAVAYLASLAVVGPALPDLSHRTNNTITDYGWLFTGRAIGYIIGTASTPFAEHVDHLVVLGFTVFVCAVFISFVPFCIHLWQISILVSFDGAAMGVLDTLGNIAVLRLWHKKEDEKAQSTVLHGFHGFFALGGLIAGLKLNFFLENRYHILSERQCVREERMR